ncbi:MAG TPA: hypothetical protein VII84_09370, partial [Acidimicrobiales bacterium]
MLAIVCSAAGLLLGIVATWALSLKRSQALRDGVTQAKADLAVRDSQLGAANETLERERAEHVSSLANMELTFENMSNRVLAQ